MPSWRVRLGRAAGPAALVAGAAALVFQEAGQARAQAALPDTPLAFGAFVARFEPGGAFTLEGEGWPRFAGSWAADGGEITLTVADAPRGCEGPGRYRYTIDGARVQFALVDDGCTPRRMILHGSTWRPAGLVEAERTRRIVRTAAERPPRRGEPLPSNGNWPSFRGPLAAGGADNQRLPDRWNGEIGATNEDGLMLVVAAGREFRHIATNPMGELLMATPALSQGVMYVRGERSLFAIGETREQP